MTYQAWRADLELRAAMVAYRATETEPIHGPAVARFAFSGEDVTMLRKLDQAFKEPEE